MVHNKTISLDEKTAIIAGRIPNFSQWVRHKLLEHARESFQEVLTVKDDHIAPLTARVWGPNKDRCNPKHKRGMCHRCYGGDE